MKKYLMTGIAAITIVAGFTNCSSHDEELYNPQPEQIAQNTAEQTYANYREAFRHEFGTPAANHTWGFGTASAVRTRAVSDYDGYRGSLTNSDYTFPSAPASYPTGKPEGAEYYSGGYKYFNGGDIYMDEHVGNKVEIQGYCDVYMVKSGDSEGNVNIAPDTQWYVGNIPYGSGQKIRVFICPGVNFTLAASQAGNLQKDVEYYVCPGASISCDTNFKLNSTALYVAPGATANFQELSGNGTALIYNQGTITTSGQIYIANSTTELINDGVITAGSSDSPTTMKLEGSGIVQNNAEMTIYGETIISSTNAFWVNNGHWTTTYYKYIAGSNYVINNCFLEVTEDFNMNTSAGIGTFRMDSGSGVLAKNFNGGGGFESYTGGPFRIEMGSNSVFKVTGTATMGASNPHYGFFGPTTGAKAVLQATTIAKGHNYNQGFEVTYGNNIAVVCQTHFAQGDDGNSAHPFIAFEGGASMEDIFTEGSMPNITIDETPCNPGFQGGTVPTTTTYRVFAEDLTTTENNGAYHGDFDFNDVVFDVEVDASGKPTKITIINIGGELPMTVAGQEIHELYGIAHKTGNDDYMYVMTSGVEPKELNVDLSAYATVYDIPVKVTKEYNDNPVETLIMAETGQEPGKICVKLDPTKTPIAKWSSERINLINTYPNFSTYVTRGENQTWYYPAE